MGVLLIRDVLEISGRTGLDFNTITDLLHSGWTFEQRKGEADRWVSPMASLPVHIPHEEPSCVGQCVNLYPHKHGLSCNRECIECHGVCHPDCPAYKKEPASAET